jgi:hypothetical protein
MKKDFAYLKRKILQLEEIRSSALDLLLSRTELICGVYSEILVKCGKLGCHCERKPIHPVTRLNVRSQGKVKCKLVRVADRKTIRQLVQTYKEHIGALRSAGKIESQERKLFKELIKMKNKSYE